MNTIHPNQLNEYMSCRKSIHENVKPGMCATMYVGSDRYPYVVVYVKTDKNISIIRLSDEDYNNNLIIKDDIQYLPEDKLKKYKLNDAKHYSFRKNYRYMPVGQDMWGTCSVHIGYADFYLDPNF